MNVSQQSNDWIIYIFIFFSNQKLLIEARPIIFELYLSKKSKTQTGINSMIDPLYPPVLQTPF